MKEVIVKIVYAFSIQGTGGNPAGVVLNANSLTNEEKQIIAAQVGLSEIAFVSSSNKADFKLDFFTPTRQIAHCGHATIAAFTYLKQNRFIKKDKSSKETIDGIRDIYFTNGMAYMEQTSPTYLKVDLELPEILQSLNIKANDLLKNFLPVIINTGNSFLIIPVKDTSLLQNLLPNQESIKKYSEKHGLIGYYAFAKSTEEDYVATARMFAPVYGINEESATGMAAGPLASYLFDNNFTKETTLIIKQGEYMTTPSPSKIYINLVLEKNKIIKLYAGGDAFVFSEKVLHL
jgi:PhzF family phenazine biosynthesis protein